MGRNRAFQIALAVSVAFHLSMVTVFSIQIPFTRPVVVYYPFDIVDPYTFEPVFRPDLDALRAPDLTALLRGPADRADDAGRSGASSPPGGNPFAALPTVHLPQLDYADLDLMAIRDMQLELERRVDAARVRPPSVNLDRQLDRIADTLIRQPLLEGFDGEARRETERVVVSQAAAPGFVAEIVWRQSPENRQVLFAPPLAWLSGPSSAAFSGPIIFDLSVAPGGQVEVVRAPIELDPPMAARLEEALEAWRFEPVNRETAQEARLTLRRRMDSAP